MTIRPVNPGHVLVIPKVHAANLSELDPEIGGRLFQVAQKIAAAIRQSGVRSEGINLFVTDGEAAGQSVFHTHLHVIPRYQGDGYGLPFGRDFGRQPPREELDRTAESIRDSLGV